MKIKEIQGILCGFILIRIKDRKLKEMALAIESLVQTTIKKAQAEIEPVLLECLDRKDLGTSTSMCQNCRRITRS